MRRKRLCKREDPVSTKTLAYVARVWGEPWFISYIITDDVDVSLMITNYETRKYRRLKLKVRQLTF